MHLPARKIPCRVPAPEKNKIVISAGPCFHPAGPVSAADPRFSLPGKEKKKGKVLF